jgi:hypothetical protein
MTPVKTGLMWHIFWPSLCFRVIGLHLFSGYRTNIGIVEMRNHFQEEEAMEQTAGVRRWVDRLVSRWMVKAMELNGAMEQGEKEKGETIGFSPVHDFL